MVQSSLERLESTITFHKLHIPLIIELLSGIEEGFEGDKSHSGYISSKMLETLSTFILTIASGPGTQLIRGFIKTTGQRLA